MGREHWKGKKPRRALDAVTQAFATYEAFALARDYYRSPFWQGARELATALNGNGDPKGFVWLNAVKLDEDGHYPHSSNVLRALMACSKSLLSDELDILKPDVAVFLTGPNYDDELAWTIDDVRVEGDRELAQIIGRGVPKHAFRTYHPNYLRRSGGWTVLHKVIALAKR